jgi:hypothetical protein
MVAGILTAAAIGLAGAGDAHEVARLTGPGSINATDRR